VRTDDNGREAFVPGIVRPWISGVTAGADAADHLFRVGRHDERTDRCGDPREVAGGQRTFLGE
jgi:hypothetical protein